MLRQPLKELRQILTLSLSSLSFGTYDLGSAHMVALSRVPNLKWEF